MLQIKFLINLNVVRASTFLLVVGSQCAAKKKEDHNGNTGHNVDDQFSFRICRGLTVDRATGGHAGLVLGNVA